MNYRTIQLRNLIKEFGKENAEKVLSNFSCPMNPDVEEFIHTKAIPFESAGMARTSLIMAQKSSLKPYRLCAIYSLTTKSIEVEKGLSRSLRKKAFGTTYAVGNPVTAILIGQLAKNYHDDNDKLITGEIIMSLISEEVNKIDMLVPSVSVWLECEDKEPLKRYYEKFGFVYFSKSEDGLLQYIMPTKKFINPEFKDKER